MKVIHQIKVGGKLKRSTLLKTVFLGEIRKNVGGGNDSPHLKNESHFLAPLFRKVSVETTDQFKQRFSRRLQTGSQSIYFVM